jgi:hypothetical protein
MREADQFNQRGDTMDTNPPATCAVCGKPAQVYVTQVRGGKQAERSLCGVHADLELHSEASAMAAFSNDDSETPKKMREMFGPGQIDQSVRQAIQFCWMMLPENAKTVDELEKQFRRIVDRAIRDLREDATAFGLPK